MTKGLKQQLLKENRLGIRQQRYINVEFMHGWHLIETKREGILTLKLGRFINKECLRGRI